MKKKLYFLSIFILFLFNISSVNAIESNFEYLQVQGYDNNGNSLTSPNQFNCSNGTCGMEITTSANSYGGAWIIQSPIPIIANHNYAISLRIRSSNYEITLSSKYQIALGNTLSNAKSNYENSTYKTELKTYNYAGNSTLQYYFHSYINASYIVIPFTTSVTTTASFMIDTIVIEDLGTESLSEQEINNITSNQTNILNDSISNSTNDINNNIKQTEENINNTLENLFKNCPQNLASSVSYTYGYIYNTSGELVSADGYYASDYITVNPSSTLTISNSTSSPTNPNLNSTLIVYDSNKNVIDFWQVYDRTINLLSNAKYIRISTFDPVTLKVFYGTTFECSGNKLDDLNETQKETNNKLDDLNDNITNSDSSEASGEAGDFFSNFNTDTFGLTSVITAPLELIKSVTSKTCSSLQLTLPFVNEDLNLPCLSTIYESYFGSFLTIYRTITFGFVSYWVCIKIFNLVKDFKNPEHDEIEVLDL